MLNFCLLILCDHATDALYPGARGRPPSRHAAGATAAARQPPRQAEDYAELLRNSEEISESSLNAEECSMEQARVLVV